MGITEGPQVIDRVKQFPSNHELCNNIQMNGINVNIQILFTKNVNNDKSRWLFSFLKLWRTLWFTKEGYWRKNKPFLNNSISKRDNSFSQYQYNSLKRRWHLSNVTFLKGIQNHNHTTHEFEPKSDTTSDMTIYKRTWTPSNNQYLKTNI